jgi:eukaryotic-like serine/threonine-protein kinase
VLRRVGLLYVDNNFDSATAVLTGLIQQRPNDLPILGLSYGQMAVVHRLRGRLREAAQWSSRSNAISMQRGAPHLKLIQAALDANASAIHLKDGARAVAMLDRALTETPIDGVPEVARPYLLLAAAYANAGRPDRARELLTTFERGRRTVVRTADAPDLHSMRGLIAIAEKRYDDAVRELQLGDQGECTTCALPSLAVAFDRGGKPDSALAVYERYVNTSEAFSWQPDQIWLAPSHRRAGELYEAKGDMAKAVEHYQKFIDLWKGADAELQPQVAGVRARVARLKDSERWTGRP